MSCYETLLARPQTIIIFTIFHISSHKKSIFGSLADSRIAFHGKADRFVDCSSLDLIYGISLTHKISVIYICTSCIPRHFKYDSNRKMYRISDAVHKSVFIFDVPKSTEISDTRIQVLLRQHIDTSILSNITAEIKGSPETLRQDSRDVLPH